MKRSLQVLAIILALTSLTWAEEDSINIIDSSAECKECLMDSQKNFICLYKGERFCCNEETDLKQCSRGFCYARGETENLNMRYLGCPSGDSCGQSTYDFNSKDQATVKARINEDEVCLYKFHIA